MWYAVPLFVQSINVLHVSYFKPASTRTSSFSTKKWKSKLLNALWGEIGPPLPLEKLQRCQSMICIKKHELNLLLLLLLLLHTPPNTTRAAHLRVSEWMCLEDMCGLFSLPPKLFMLLTPQWSTQRRLKRISGEEQGEVGQGGVDPEGGQEFGGGGGGGRGGGGWGGGGGGVSSAGTAFTVLSDSE